MLLKIPIQNLRAAGGVLRAAGGVLRAAGAVLRAAGDFKDAKWTPHPPGAISRQWPPVRAGAPTGSSRQWPPGLQ